MKLVIVVCVIVGILHGMAKIFNALHKPVPKPCQKPSMGHHYQRDTVFHDILGM
jgi:hypothetical protein